MKKTLLILVVILLLPIVYGAIDPAFPFCTEQGYEEVSITETMYNGERLIYKVYQGGSPIEIVYKGEIIKLLEERGRYIERENFRIDRSELELGRGESYCVFDDGEMCKLREFYEGGCGEGYVKEFSCVDVGEVVFPQFQECCEGKPHLAPNLIGQPSCQPFSKRLTENLMFNPIFWVVGVIILIIVGFIIIKKREKSY